MKIKRLLLLGISCLLFFGCNYKAQNALKDQNSSLAEENEKLKNQIKNLENQNENMSLQLKVLTAQVDENDIDETLYDYSGEWFTDWLNVNGIDMDISICPSLIILKRNHAGFYDVIGCSGVNIFLGQIETDEHSIKMSEEFVYTENTSSAEKMDFENQFMKCLLGAEKIEISRSGDGKYLIISNSSDNIQLGFRHDSPSSWIPDISNP